MAVGWSSLDAGWRWAFHVGDAWCTHLGGARAIAVMQAIRREELLGWARRHSRLYRERLSRLGPDPAWETVPVVTKEELMARFDDWVTDPEVTRAGVEAFVAERANIGKPFLGRYAVFSSSGTTGVRGLFVQDAAALSIYDALAATRLGALAPAGDARQLLAGHRVALIAATEGHFAGVVSWQRLRAIHPGFRMRSCVIPVTAPIGHICRELERFRPTVVAAYATMLSALARERGAGRLDLSPAVLWYGGEWMSPAARAEIESAFGCRVAGDYGASEFMNMAFECEQGEMHLNADWLVLEPVDEKRRAVPAGKPSASVLLTNLANRVQPLIRYELGDSVEMPGESCGCGRPFPIVRVEGRRDEILQLADPRGRRVAILPLAIATVLEEGAHVHRFQVVQVGRSKLSVRLACKQSETVEAFAAIRRELAAFLRLHGLANVTVAVSRAALVRHPASGKLRTVWREDGAFGA
jgi:phenylacetate-coenzyme A ligase PaaK-like adenylate-forming protein